MPARHPGAHRRIASAPVLHRRSLIALLLTAAVLAACGDDDSADAEGTAESGRATSGGRLIGPANEGVEGVEALQIDSRDHTEDDLAYDRTPPAGGEHFPVPATCGFYAADDPAEVPPDEMLVHSLEHGAIWIAYSPDLDDAAVATLRDLAGQERKVVVTPHEGLPAPLVVTAWARQMPLEDPEDPRLMQFILQYREAGEAPEPAAVCQGAGNPAVASPAP